MSDLLIPSSNVALALRCAAPLAVVLLALLLQFTQVPSQEALRRLRARVYRNGRAIDALRDSQEDRNG